MLINAFPRDLNGDISRWPAEIPTTGILGNFWSPRRSTDANPLAVGPQIVITLETVFVIPSYRDTPFSSAYRYYRSLFRRERAKSAVSSLKADTLHT